MKRIHPFWIVLVFVSLSGLVYAAQGRGKWEMLGHTQADFKRDHDRIDVGSHEGRFRQLEVRVQGAPVEIHRMVVTFTNDQKFEPNFRQRFDESTRSHIVDLPGDRRAIKHIDIWYSSPSRRQGKATVEVYGRN